MGFLPMNKTVLKTAAITIALLAVINRVPQAKKIVNGQ
jgi:hypothetical protein